MHNQEITTHVRETKKWLARAQDDVATHFLCLVIFLSYNMRMNLKYVISFLYLNDAFNIIFGEAGYLCFRIISSSPLLIR